MSREFVAHSLSLSKWVALDDVPVLQEPHQLEAEEDPDESWSTELKQNQEGARPDEPEVLRLPDEDPEVEPAHHGAPEDVEADPEDGVDDADADE